MRRTSVLELYTQEIIDESVLAEWIVSNLVDGCAQSYVILSPDGRAAAIVCDDAVSEMSY
jgi:hypothetical protein